MSGRVEQKFNGMNWEEKIGDDMRLLVIHISLTAFTLSNLHLLMIPLFKCVINSLGNMQDAHQ